MKPKILIIEDNEQNLYMISYLLENNNYEVIKAYNGKDGIELAIEHNPDAVILDIQLPEMDGYEVARELRKIEILKDVLIIVFTSYAMVGDKEKALASGADGYIDKPIDTDSFISQLEGYLLKKKSFDD
ncbi:MAG: response regulator [Candidatus Cloacimonetes bacterium]|nr:response regulator [Candidatus Cloacimonadota bacterium]